VAARPTHGYYSKNRSEVDVYLTHASRPVNPNKFSKFIGVHKNSNPLKPYRAAIRFKGKKYQIGVFADEIEAAKAYNKVALSLIGPRALINEIPETTQESN
jgi:hypothetical protein